MNLKKFTFRAALLIGAAALLIFASCGLPGAQAGGYAGGSGRAVTVTTNTTNTDTDDYFYSFWKGDNEGSYTGSASMTIDTGTTGNYKTSWNNVSNFTAGKGWKTGSASRVVKFTGSFNGSDNGYLALYGWATTSITAPADKCVVEYYVVENYGNWTPPGGASKGTFTSDGGTYDIYQLTRTTQPWVVNGDKGTFDQYWSVRTTKRSSGTITFANHVAAWANVGLTFNSVSTYYQIMETEGYRSTGSSDITVSEGSSGGGGGTGISAIANTTFSGSGDGNRSTPETGDNRGYQTGVAGYPAATFTIVSAELPITIQFGAISGSQISVTITMANVMGTTAVVSGMGDINGDNITVTGGSFLDQFVIHYIDNDTLYFRYHIYDSNPRGFGTVARSGGPGGSPFIINYVNSALAQQDKPATFIPKIGSGAASITVNSEWSAYSVESGEWNGVVQLQFTNPSSPKVKQIEVLTIDPVGVDKTYDFKAANSNPNYWGWGGEMKFPQAHTRYMVIIHKVVSNPVSFTLRAW